MASIIITYPPENGSEQLSRHGDLGHLEDDVSGIVDDLGADLDHLLPQGRHRPVTNALRQRHLPEEVPQVVGKGEELQPYLVVGEVMAGEAHPLHGVLTLLDHLLRRSPVVVEPHHGFGRPGEIGHNEPDTGEEFAAVPFHLGDYPALVAPSRGLVLEIVVQDDKGLGRPSHRSREEMPDLAGQDVVGGQPDGVAESLRLEVLVDGGIGERRVAAKVPAEFPIAVPSDNNRIEHGLRVRRAQRVAL